LREQARPGTSVLNLFAYTGGSTLAAAAAGASVVHVDAARSAVGWARRNAELSDLAARPIRWIADDVEPFVGREQRRGRRYDGIVLDPPGYGHGSRGRTWRLEHRLPALLEACAAILAAGGFVVLTTHDPELDHARLAAYLRTAFRDPAHVEAFEVELHATSGARLWLGSCARMISAL
jgi:23S rRNA (cytosine1962-C5)-methyltransferase